MRGKSYADFGSVFWQKTPIILVRRAESMETAESRKVLNYFG